MSENDDKDLPLLLVAIERSKERKRLHEELIKLAQIYVNGGECREQMADVLARIELIPQIGKEKDDDY